VILELTADESACSFLAISLPPLSKNQATAQNPNDTDTITANTCPQPILQNIRIKSYMETATQHFYSYSLAGARVHTKQTLPLPFQYKQALA